DNGAIDMDAMMDNLKDMISILEKYDKSSNETPTSDDTTDENIAKFEVAAKSKGLAAAHTWCIGCKTFGIRTPKDSIVADQDREGKRKV
ncbi:hypothetical protein Tco_0478850, partial [Tanacetum coccineum]